MALTAGDVVNRIKAVMAVQGVPWSDASTRDRFKFGGPDTVVTGIATTFMGTFEAISRAAERGLNMIIPHEDTYWNDADNTLIAEADTLVHRAKIDFMTKHDIVVFRIHDHMHRQRPGLHVLRHGPRDRPRSVNGNGTEFTPVRDSRNDPRRARGAGQEDPRR
jgi:hypothetical protein